MNASLIAVAFGLFASSVLAQTPQDFEAQVVRGVAQMNMARARQLPSGEWLRERIEVGSVARTIRQDGSGQPPVLGVVTASIKVRHSRKVTEAQAHSEKLPVDDWTRRYEVELGFVPDAAYGQWAFEGGRYWTLDAAGNRHLELRMIPDLLTEAPVDAPHELAWAIMSP